MADATFRTYDRVGARWVIGYAASGCPGGGECLRGLAVQASAALGFDVAAPELKNDPRHALEAIGSGHRRAPYAPGAGDLAPQEELRSEEEWAEAASELRRGRSPRAAAARRACTRMGIDYRDHDLALVVRRGYDALAVPVFVRGVVVNEAFRWIDPRAHAVYRRKDDSLFGGTPGLIAGVPWALIDDRQAIVVAGFRDVLIGRQEGLPTVSGLGQWGLREAVGELAELGRVAVMLDVGEEQAAAEIVAKLREFGAEAWIVRLSKLGLGPGGDLSEYVQTGGAIEDLAKHIGRERRESS